VDGVGVDRWGVDGMRVDWLSAHFAATGLKM
jgi:hypothetical protein